MTEDEVLVRWLNDEHIDVIDQQLVETLHILQKHHMSPIGFAVYPIINGWRIQKIY